MKDTAAEWYTNVALQKAMEEDLWTSLPNIWRDVEKGFGDTNPELTARAQLSKISQGTHSVHKYNNEFNEVSIRM